MALGVDQVEVSEGRVGSPWPGSRGPGTVESPPFVPRLHSSAVDLPTLPDTGEGFLPVSGARPPAYTGIVGSRVGKGGDGLCVCEDVDGLHLCRVEDRPQDRRHNPEWVQWSFRDSVLTWSTVLRTIGKPVSPTVEVASPDPLYGVGPW